MQVTFGSKGGFDNTLSWLAKMTNNDATIEMEQIAKEGVASLSSNTPRDTGETASGWTYKISHGFRTTEIEWFNTAHPEAKVNIAKLIELGYGTGNGGYVLPRPYIHRSMDAVFKNAGDRLAKGMVE